MSSCRATNANGTRVLRYSDSDDALLYAETRGLEVDWSSQIRTDLKDAAGLPIWSAPVVGGDE